MSDLCLTLGHNASALAITVQDGVATVENAYELERLSGVKSDSHFPMDAMIALKDRGTRSFDRVYVTHWDPVNHVDDLKSKYWDRSVFPTKVPVITQESLGKTHHDCHMHAALAFAGTDFPLRDSAVLVIDGFGSFAEHLSYYRFDGAAPILAYRLHGYRTSLGLMYQYATAFLGMKMHEDEYKLLGYGSKVIETGADLGRLAELSLLETKRLLKEMRSLNAARMDPSLDGLPDVQEMWAKRFAVAMDEMGMQGIANDSFEARCVIGWFVQSVLEQTIENLFTNELRKPTNLIVTGGVALNVELNRRLLKTVTGKLCVMPLAGDQGNSLGLWAFHNKQRARLDFGDLCWGKRQTGSFVSDTGDLPDGMFLVEEDGPEVLEVIRNALVHPGFVNVVRGRMEFGPRALCNTTTLARADDPAIVDEINRINGRDTVMPFAPVVWHERADMFFPDLARVHKSGGFMICAMDYAPGVWPNVPGASLKTYRNERTGRPQVYEPRYDGDSVAAVVEEYRLLINTSFNVHGVPICCDLKDAIHSHQYQHERNPKVRTIVIHEKEKA